MTPGDEAGPFRASSTGLDPAAALAGGVIERAWARRGDLHARTDIDAYRLFHGRGDGLPGLEIDRWGDAITIAYPAALAAHLPAIVDAIDRCQRFSTIAVRPRPGEPFARRGLDTGGEREVTELGIRYAVDLLTRGGNPGLFLDARPAREWIRAHSAGRRVLNLFSFTGSLGIAAAVGGARSVTHVDVSAQALARCRSNSALSGVRVDARDLVRVNVYQHLRRASAARMRCDAIIADPPPLGPAARRSDRTPGERGLVALAPRVVSMLAPGGWLLCFFHPRDPADEAQVVAAAGAPLRELWRGAPGVDFPGSGMRIVAFETG